MLWSRPFPLYVITVLHLFSVLADASQNDIAVVVYVNNIVFTYLLFYVLRIPARDNAQQFQCIDECHVTPSSDVNAQPYFSEQYNNSGEFAVDAKVVPTYSICV